MKKDDGKKKRKKKTNAIAKKNELDGVMKVCFYLGRSAKNKHIYTTTIYDWVNGWMQPSKITIREE